MYFQRFQVSFKKYSNYISLPIHILLIYRNLILFWVTLCQKSRMCGISLVVKSNGEESERRME